MARGKNYRQAILVAVDEMNGWGKEVHLDALMMDTGLEEHQVSNSIATMRKAGYPITVARKDGRKHIAWTFQNMSKWTDKVVADSKAKGEAFKGTNYVAQTGHNTLREAANAKTVKAVTEEDMERGRRVLLNFDRLPQEVKDKIEVLKEIAPEYTEDLENVLVKVLGLPSVQDTDPSFWAVDQFADGSLMLARKDGTHWKATKL